MEKDLMREINGFNQMVNGIMFYQMVRWQKIPSLMDIN